MDNYNNYNNNNNNFKLNIINEYNNFKNKNYQNFSIEELKELLIKYYVPLSTIKKEKLEMYEQVSNLLETQMKLLKEYSDKEKREINSFNKDQVELKIKDISETERLFWSVFRYKATFKAIFSNFFLSRSFNYDRLYNIDYVLELYSNGKEILIDKIKNNKYLFFNHNSIQLMCRYLRKDTSENRFILNQIFNEKYSNLISLNEVFSNSISESNILVLKLLKENLKQKEFNQLISKCSKIFFKIKSYKQIKFLNYYINQIGNSKKHLKIFDLSIEKNIIFKESFKLKHLIKLIQNSFPYVFPNIDKKDIKSIEETFKKFSIKDERLSKLNIIQLPIPKPLVNKYENDTDEGREFKTNLIEILLYYYKVAEKSSIPIDHCILFLDGTQISKQFNDTKPNKPLLKKLLYYFRKFNEKKVIIDQDYFHLVLKEFRKIDPISHLSHLSQALGSVISINNLELIKFILKEYQDKFNNIVVEISPKIISSIKSTCVLDFFFENFKDSILFSDKNHLCYNVSDLEILEHYESLMGKLGFKFYIEKFCNETEFNSKNVNPSSILKRALLNQNENIKVYEFSKVFPIDKQLVEFFFIDNKFGNEIELRKSTLEYFNFQKIQFLNDDNFYGTLNKKFIKWILDNSVKQIPIIENYDPKGTINIQVKLKNNKMVEFEISHDLLINILYINGYYEEITQINGIKLSTLSNKLYYYFNPQFIDKLFSKYFVLNSKDVIYSSEFCNGWDLYRFLTHILYSSNLKVFELFFFKYNQIFKIIVKMTIYPSDNFSNNFQLEDIFFLDRLIKNSIDVDNFEFTKLLLNYASIPDYIKLKPSSIIYKNLYSLKK